MENDRMPNLSRFISAGLILFVGLSANLGLSRSFDLVRVGQGHGTLQNDPVRIQRFSVSSFWEVFPQIAIGPVFTASYTDEATEIFDHYREGSLGLDAMASYDFYVPFGLISPYLRTSIRALSYFQASGKIKGSKSSSFAPTSSSSINYELSGQNNGWEGAIGTAFSLSNSLSLLLETGVINNTLSFKHTSSRLKANRRGSVSDFEPRSGINLRQNENFAPLEVEPANDNPAFRMQMFSVGLSYRL